MQNQNSQLVNLIRQGFTKAEACAALGLDIDVAELALASNNEKKFNLQSAREDFIPRAYEILKEIAEMGERDCDKIKACQIIIQGEGMLPEVNMQDYSERIKMMKRAMGECVIDVDFNDNHDSQKQLAVVNQ